MEMKEKISKKSEQFTKVKQEGEEFLFHLINMEHEFFQRVTISLRIH